MSDTNPTITLYRADGACSLAPHILLKELGIPFQDVLMKLGETGIEAADGSISVQEYRKIHHAGYVPCLQVNDMTITEMPAVLTYIASLRPEQKLLGSTDLERAKAAEWMAYLSGTLHASSFGRLFRPQRFVEDEAQYQAVRELGKKNIQACFERINGLLAGRECAVGNATTVVDFNLLVFWYWALSNGLSVAGFAAYENLVRRLEAKGSVRETLRLEGIKLAIGE